MKNPIFAANWKCNLDASQVAAFTQWAKQVDITQGHVILFGSACYLSTLTPLTRNQLWIGAQDVSTQDKGAYTGEVAAFQLKSLGIKMVLVGHSERRHVFKESQSVLNQKLQRLQAQDLATCYCVGETLAERESGKTLPVVKTQIKPFLDLIKSAAPTTEFRAQSSLAYEPVWAIGTGKNATAKEIQEVHQALHQELQAAGLKHLPILYGGSVNEKNAAEILKTPGVEGVLVGGASNQPKTFDAIRHATE